MRFECVVDPSDERQLRAVKSALNICCREGDKPIVDEDGVVSIELAVDATVEGVRALVDIALRPAEVPPSPTPIEESQATIIMPDGLPFVLNQ